MIKVRSITQLQDLLDKDIAWRLKEITFLKSIFLKHSGHESAALIRAAVPILYAHWEGFVKNSAQWYLSYVRYQELKYNELKSCFTAFGIKNALNTIRQSKKANINIEAIEFIRAKLNEKTKFSVENSINTESNLNSEVFENIALSIGLDPSSYSSKYQLIDSSLLRRRNEIAHGQFLDIEAKDCETLADETLTLIRGFKNDIENAASLNAFKIKP